MAASARALSALRLLRGLVLCEGGRGSPPPPGGMGFANNSHCSMTCKMYAYGIRRLGFSSVPARFLPSARAPVSREACMISGSWDVRTGADERYRPSAYRHR